MAADERKFTALGRDWTARFDFNSICALEERYDKPFLELVAPFMAGVELGEDGKPDEASAVAAASRIKFIDLRAIFHQALLAAHPDATPDQAGSVIADMGLDGAMQIVAWAIVSAMPTPKGDGGNGKKSL